MTVKFIGVDGPHDVELEGMKYHVMANKEGLSYRQVINREFPTKAGDPDAFSQFCVSAGLQFEKNEVLGTMPTNLQSVLKPEAGSNQTGGSFTGAPGTPDSTILFAPAILETVEASLLSNTDAAVNAFETLVGKRTSIPGKEFKQPVVNYAGKKGPENFEWKRATQNAEPSLMLSITAADVSRNVPTYSMGMEVSADAMLIAGVDMIVDPLKRFVMKANYKDWITNIGLILNGDPDGVTSDMDDNTAALASVTAASFDSSIVTAGTITQEAWVKFLYSNSMDMTKKVMLMDIDTALAIDSRGGRPTNVMNNSTDRIDVPFVVSYPMFDKTVDFIIMPEGTFTANTVMALDTDWALHKVTSLFAQYQAVEDMILRRSTVMRFDTGSLTYRQYTEAFNVMTLTV